MDAPELERQMRYFKNLVEGDYPAFLKAHYLVAVLFPTMMKAIGIEECSNELAMAFTRQISSYTGTCLQCHKAQEVPGEDFCPKCLAEYDQFEAEVEGR